MAKRSSDSLHLLIKSLNKTEKRYFKMFMQNNIKRENKIFDVLFDAIDKQTEYNEKEIIEKFKDKSFSKQFALTKTRLYEQILRSLDALYADSSVDAELKQNLHFVEILFRKTLYKQAEKLLYHTKKKALKSERISSLIEISLWQKKLLEKTGYAGNAEEKIKELAEHDAWLLFQLGVQNNFWELKSNLFSSLNKTGGMQNSTKFLEELNAKTQNIDYKDLTVENKYIYHHTYSAYYYGVHNYQLCYFHLTENSKLIEENSFLFTDEPNIYFSILSNLIFICAQLKKPTEAQQALLKLKNIEKVFDLKHNEDLLLKHFNMLSSAEISYYKLNSKYTEALIAVEQIEISLVKFIDKLNPTRKAFYFFNLSAIYFANAKYNKAIKWCNELLNDKSIDEIENYRAYAQVLSLLIHIELAHRDYYAVLIAQLEKQLATTENVSEFFKLMLEMGKIFSKESFSLAEKEKLNDIAKQLNTLKSNGDVAFEFFDFERWLSSRNAGLPFSMLQSVD